MIDILAEAERLHGLGFAVHWLYPKSKVPRFPGWTTGMSRATWNELTTTYKKGMNIGVRLGHTSNLEGTYLAVIDVDVKSDEPRHRQEAEEALFDIFPEVREGPFIHSGRGNGSAHYYVRLKAPTSGDETKAQSQEIVRVKMPSVDPSENELNTLSFEDVAVGWRLRKAWEVSLLSEGRQCVLAGSRHPDTNKFYEWGKSFASVYDIPFLTAIPPGLNPDAVARKAPRKDKVTDWVFKDVDLGTLDLRDDQVAAIQTGKNVSDESAKVYELTLALLSRGVAEDVIVSLFTDKSYHLGKVSYRHARTNNRRYAAAWVERYNILKAKIKIDDCDFDLEEIDEPTDEELKRKRNAKPKKRKSKLKKLPPSADVVIFPVGLSEPPLPWEQELELKYRGKLLAPLVRASYTNVWLILQNSCEKVNFLSLDSFAMKACYTCDTPWGKKKNQERSPGNEDALIIKGWLHRKYEMVAPLSMVEELLNRETFENAYHPLKDYLNSLEWDGVPRINNALRTYFGARMPEPYLTSVSRKLFIGAVKRIFEPGCTFQFMVVLEGRQGIGKSTGIEILSGKRWFLDNLPNLHDKDAAGNLLGTWLCEIAELTALMKTDSGAAKAFISRNTDRFRPPYGARRVDYPRNTIFIGTTNHRDYLTDHTGNRRYWPVACFHVDFKGLIRDRDQLWAEAVSENLWSNEILCLPRGSKALEQAEAIQELARTEDEIDYMKDEFRRWEAETIKEEGSIPSALTMVGLFEKAWAKTRADKSSMMRAAIALRQLGYEKEKKNSGNIWCKKRPENSY